jgi:uncharacterized membrane protein YraQ (UPF0718 family)
METYLFYAYLKYAKENKQSFWPKLLSRPISVIIFFSLTLLSCVCGAIFALLGWSIAALIGMVGEIVFGIIFYNCSEKYQIDFCVEEYDKYVEYCANLHKWLKKFNKPSADDIQELYDKIQAKITRMKTEEENSKARGDRWLQTLIIPAIIAIITTIIAKQENIEEMLAYALVIVILFAVVYGTIAIIKSIGSFPQKRRIEQMECFASDLQGVLDFINSNAKKKQ